MFFGKKKSYNEKFPCSKYGTMQDYSNICTRNEQTAEQCLACTNYVYPIGCKLKDINKL